MLSGLGSPHPLHGGGDSARRIASSTVSSCFPTSSAKNRSTKPQHEMAVLLQEQVLAAVATIGLGTVEMLRAVRFNDNPCFSTQQVLLP